MKLILVIFAVSVTVTHKLFEIKQYSTVLFEDAKTFLSLSHFLLKNLKGKFDLTLTPNKIRHLTVQD